jgi:5-oxopent-3-ene-1,2,5-tricarboxylate decarboxylase / 2-hydroxyhepta-2,4-diene-1,7-dioate isomerase
MGSGLALMAAWYLIHSHLIDYIAHMLVINTAPWKLSGTVVGPLLNDPAALAALGEAAHAAPYKAPPRAPVLYVKPRNTLAGSGATPSVPAGAPGLEVAATLGLVIGRTACRVRVGDAPGHIAAWVLVADLSVPHTSFYRPSVRFKARDHTCLIGPAIAAAGSSFAPEAARLRVSIDGQPVQELTLAGMQRPAARLLEDVTEFMTLHAGDVLLLGTRHSAPLVGAGHHFTVACEGLGSVEGHVVSEAAEVYA